ncbi:MAG: 3-deoxy-D-manno-octulosonic acid transferase, partial [Boseongicola sp.]|nr:3-deoxy-D-manno-octulosonic acid transferase [Boseongicola sp.]
MTGFTASTLRYRCAVACYQTALWLGMPLVWRYFRKRALKDPEYGLALDERRGIVQPNEVDVWIHAVSLGEYRSAEPTIKHLLAAGLRLHITHLTPAGRKASTAALAKEVEAGKIQISYAPVDRISYWSRFLRTIRPKIGLAFEMEYWPGMAEAANKTGVQLWYVNSQIPSKTFPRARRFARALGDHPAARGARVLAKSGRMAERFEEIGARNIDVMGETRFDIAPPDAHLEAGETLRQQVSPRPVFAFASVVAGEESVYGDAVAELKSNGTNPFVVWVPRAPETFEKTYEYLCERGFRVARRSSDMSDELTAL